MRGADISEKMRTRRLGEIMCTISVVLAATKHMTTTGTRKMNILPRALVSLSVEILIVE